MDRLLTVVCYHYVRDLGRSRYPKIRACNITRFRSQLDYIGRSHTVVTMAEVIAAIHQGAELPPYPALLTFDDGYVDHFSVVFPLLHERGWEGTFFVPAQTVVENRLLDVNKIHFVLASVNDPTRLVEHIARSVADGSVGGERLASWERYLQAYYLPSRWDPPEIAFVKRMLQNGLPEQLRTALCDELFARFVTTDQAAFAAELYCSADQLRMMNRCGMSVGCHGYSHCWLDHLDQDSQENEVDLSLRFLKSLGAATDSWVISYPYGRYNQSLVDVCLARGCVLGLTVAPAMAKLGEDHFLRLPRMDTNALPA